MNNHDLLNMKFGRRRLLQSSVALAATFALPQIGQAANDRVVFANWGGSWEKAMRKAWADPFAKESGIQVVSASGNTLGKLQAMVEANKTEWDLMEGLPELAQVGAEKGLLEKLDFSVIDRSQMMKRADFMDDYSIPEVIFGRVLVYNKSLPDVPHDWSALWDVKKFPGKRALYNKVESGLLEMSLIADGVSADKLYPLDVPRALKKLGEIKPHILWYETVTQSEQVMRDGQASMGVLADGRALSIKDSGAPIELQPEASLLTWSVFVVPKGAPNKAAAMKFLAYVLSLKAQVAEALEYNYGPVVPKAWEQIPAERLKIISGGPSTAGKAVFLNSKWWAANLERTTEQFHQWLLS